MPKFIIQITIENKPGISDPEGATILQDLVLKGTKAVSDIRTAKVLKFTITEKTKKSAKDTIIRICNEFRVYNPMVSTITVKILNADK